MNSPLCEHCRAELPESTQRRLFCNAKCRAAAWQAAKRNQDARLRELVKVLAKEAGLGPEDFA